MTRSIVKIDKLSGLLPNFYMACITKLTLVVASPRVASCSISFLSCYYDITWANVLFLDNFWADGKRNCDVIN